MPSFAALSNSKRILMEYAKKYKLVSLKHVLFLTHTPLKLVRITKLAQMKAT